AHGHVVARIRQLLDPPDVEPVAHEELLDVEPIELRRGVQGAGRVARLFERPADSGHVDRIHVVNSEGGYAPLPNLTPKSSCAGQAGARTAVFSHARRRRSTATREARLRTAVTSCAAAAGHESSDSRW